MEPIGLQVCATERRAPSVFRAQVCVRSHPRNRYGHYAQPRVAVIRRRGPRQPCDARVVDVVLHALAVTLRGEVRVALVRGHVGQSGEKAASHSIFILLEPRMELIFWRSSRAKHSHVLIADFMFLGNFRFSVESKF